MRGIAVPQQKPGEKYGLVIVMTIQLTNSGPDSFSPRLPPHILHLWLCDQMIGEDEYDRLWEILDSAERERASRFYFQDDRVRFAAYRGQLKLLLAWYCNRPPKSVDFILGGQGKPRLKGTDPDRGLVFNLSHSSDRALIAVGYNQVLGVDLECWRKLTNFESMVNRCFSDLEKNYWLSLSSEKRQQCFFSYWAAKESIMKAQGQGISLGMDHCVLSYDPGPRFLSLPACCGDPLDWDLSYVNCGERFSGALAVKDRNCRIIYRKLPKKWLFDLYFPSGVV